ncbi:MAG: PilN domain-containing protein [Pseudomonadota bacterium]
MSRINLLPWREARRKEQLNQFAVSVVVVALMAGGVWFAVHYYHQQLIDRQNDRIAYIDQQIEVVDKKIKEIKALEREKSRLLSRMRAIEQLQGNRPLIVRLFDEVITALPEGMTVTSIQQKGNSVKMQGLAQSNARVSSFMRNIDSSEWIANPNLQFIKEDKRNAKGDSSEAPINAFTLSFTQVIPNLEEDEES